MTTDGLIPVPDDLEFGQTIRGFIQDQQVFGRYKLRSILGRGGMGLVWLAHDEHLQEDVALKFLPELVRLDAVSLEELKRETRRSRKLAHSNIVKVYDFSSDTTSAAISMEYVSGATLSGLRAKRKNLCFEVEEVEDWMRQLIMALIYAHEDAKVVHRDLKPANIMVDETGKVKVTDFGIASSISESVSRVTVQRGTSGTLVYMSPQQALGEDPAVTDDIYSLGATIFELLTGKPPFYTGDVMTQIREKSAPALSARRNALGIEGQAIPGDWEEAIAACLAKEPSQRPQSMIEVAERLHFGVVGIPISGKQRVVQVPVKVNVPQAVQFQENSLGMKFVPAGTQGALFSMYPTRVSDFEAFVEATRHDATEGCYSMGIDGWKRYGDSWKKPGFAQTKDHPVAGVSWNDAKAFCLWLTQKERQEGRLASNQIYRLPWDVEWSKAVGDHTYPWGGQWPPPSDAGNYAHEAYASGTSPVGSFKPNNYQLFDLGGGVWEWCEDWYREGMTGNSSATAAPRSVRGQDWKAYRVLRGASWRDSLQINLRSSYRAYAAPASRCTHYGFRCVMMVNSTG